MPHILSDDLALGIEYVSLADELRDVQIVTGTGDGPSPRVEAAALLREARTLLQILHNPSWVGREDPILDLGSALLPNLIARCYGVTRPDGTWGIGTIVDLIESDDPMTQRQIFQAADAIDDVARLFHDLMLRASGDLRRRCWAVHRASTSLHQKRQVIGLGMTLVECDVCRDRTYEMTARREGWLVSEEKDYCPSHRPDGLTSDDDELEPIGGPSPAPVLVTSGEGAWESFVAAARLAFEQGDSAAEFSESCVQALGEEARADLVRTLTTSTETGPLTSENVSEPAYVTHALAAFLRRASNYEPPWEQQQRMGQGEAWIPPGPLQVLDPQNPQDRKVIEAFMARSGVDHSHMPQAGDLEEASNLNAELDLAEALALGELMPPPEKPE